MHQGLHIPIHTEITKPMRSKCAEKQKRDINFIPLPVYCSNLCCINIHTPKHTLPSLPNYGVNPIGNHENSPAKATFDDFPGEKKKIEKSTFKRALTKISPTRKLNAKALRAHSYRAWEQNANSF